MAAELSRNGYLAAVTLRNSDHIDILASSIDTENQIAIQVKTTQGKDTWILNKKVENEAVTAQNKYYAFVSLTVNVNQQPRYSIIKATDLASFVKKAHQDWLLAPGKNRKDHNARQYEEKWARAAGFRTFNSFRDFLQNVDNKGTPVIDENITIPSSLLPVHNETFVLREVEIPTYNITFNLWGGEPIINTFGGKPLIHVGGKPMFAELAVTHLFLEDGWEARWLESYGRGQRNIVCLPMARPPLRATNGMSDRK